MSDAFRTPISESDTDEAERSIADRLGISDEHEAEVESAEDAVGIVTR